MKSIRTLVWCGVVTAGLSGGVGALAPEQSVPGVLERQAKPLTPENPVPRRVNFEPPEYPAEAASAGARGTATVMITVDETGRVAEARRTGIQVTATNPPVSFGFSGATSEDEARFLVNRSVEQSDTMRAVSKAMTEAAIRSVMLWRYDPPANAPISFPVSVSFMPQGADGARPSVELTATMYQGGDAPVRVGGNIRTPTKVRNVSPAYPADAQAQRVAGLVILEATIGRDGRVTDAKVLRSIPMLDQAAIDAVMQWEFTPTLLNGVPVPVIMTVTVNFTLG